MVTSVFVCFFVLFFQCSEHFSSLFLLGTILKVTTPWKVSAH